MRKIVKTSRPESMEKWFSDNIDTPECLGFRNEMPTNVRNDLKSKLLFEQGYLCGYTGLEISDANSHIEHVKPYSECKDNEGKYTQESYDYFNLITCFPKKLADLDVLPVKIKNLDFGAVYRENKNTNFLHPLIHDSENRFRFDIYGEITPTSLEDIYAVETIKTLGLDSENLTELRAYAINGELGLAENPIPIEEMEQLLEVIDQPDKNGKLKSFCFVIKQALQFYLYGEVT
jgi:uncharacterized protein (TIGR02646 family)